MIKEIKPNAKITSSGSEMPFPSKLSDIPLRNILKRELMIMEALIQKQ